MTDLLRGVLAAALALIVSSPMAAWVQPPSRMAPDLRDRPATPHPHDQLIPIRVVDADGAPVVGLGSRTLPPTDADGWLQLKPGWHRLCGGGDGFRVDPDTDDRTWTLPPRCQVRLEPEVPRPGTTLRVPSCEDVPFDGPVDVTVPCDGLSVDVLSPAGTMRHVRLAPRERPIERIPEDSAPMLPLRVTARTSDGRPVPDASVVVLAVQGLEYGETAALDAPLGGADLEAPPGAGLLVVAATADGFSTRIKALSVGLAGLWLPLDHFGPPGRRPTVASVVLTPERTLPVRCAGLPDDDCDSVGGASCTWTPTWGGTVTCEGDGPWIVSAGRHRVAVPADASVAWIDFRDDAAVEVRGAPEGARLHLQTGDGDLDARDRRPHQLVGVPPGDGWLCATGRGGRCVTPPMALHLAPGERRVLTWEDLKAPATR